MYCSYCGKKIADDSMFCCYCGRRLTILEQNDEEKVEEAPKAAPAPVAVEEPVIEEPVIDEPVAEEPVIEEPVVEEPVVEEPVIEEPVIEEPVVEEPVIEEHDKKKVRVFGRLFGRIDVPEQAEEAPVQAEAPVEEEPVAEEPVAEEAAPEEERPEIFTTDEFSEPIEEAVPPVEVPDEDMSVSAPFVTDSGFTAISNGEPFELRDNPAVQPFTFDAEEQPDEAEQLEVAEDPFARNPENAPADDEADAAAEAELNAAEPKPKLRHGKWKVYKVSSRPVVDSKPVEEPAEMPDLPEPVAGSAEESADIPAPPLNDEDVENAYIEQSVIYANNAAEGGEPPLSEEPVQRVQVKKKKDSTAILTVLLAVMLCLVLFLFMILAVQYFRGRRENAVHELHESEETAEDEQEAEELTSVVATVSVQQLTVNDEAEHIFLINTDNGEYVELLGKTVEVVNGYCEIAFSDADLYALGNADEDVTSVTVEVRITADGAGLDAYTEDYTVDITRPGAKLDVVRPEATDITTEGDTYTFDINVAIGSEVTFNGEPLEYDETTGHAEIEVELTEDVNEYVIVVAKEGYNVTERTYTIRRANPAELYINIDGTEPLEAVNGALSVSGTTIAGATVTVNGTSAAVDEEGNFSCDTAVKYNGYSKLELVAALEGENPVTKQLLVYNPTTAAQFTTSAWGIEYERMLGDENYLNGQHFQVKGKVKAISSAANGGTTVIVTLAENGGDVSVTFYTAAGDLPTFTVGSETEIFANRWGNVDGLINFYGVFVF